MAAPPTLTIPVEMRVGGLEETITVTGETPVVDVQSVRRETVLSSDTISAIPATRTVGSLLNATPGLTVDGNGVAVTPTMTFFSARGGQVNEGRMAVNGMTVAATFNGGGVSSYILDTANVDEVSVVVSGGMGETDIGAPTMNLVPKGGGNSFSGQAFINEAGDWSRSSNIDDKLRAVGLTDPPGIIKSYDASVSYGGPIKRDKLWFFGSYRKLNTETNIEGIVANANAYDMSKWAWAPGQQRQGACVTGPHDVHRADHGAADAEAPLLVQPRVPGPVRRLAAEGGPPKGAIRARPTGSRRVRRPRRPKRTRRTSTCRTT